HPDWRAMIMIQAGVLAMCIMQVFCESCCRTHRIESPAYRRTTSHQVVSSWRMRCTPDAATIRNQINDGSIQQDGIVSINTERCGCRALRRRVGGRVGNGKYLLYRS